MTARPRQNESHRVMWLRGLGGLNGWSVTSAAVEAKRVVSVGRTKWTACYKVHVIPSRRIQYKTSITLWPRTTTTLASRRHPGWHPDLAKAKWYQACTRELRRHGYRGRWLWSPSGRFGDFWKTLGGADSLAREVRLLDRLRRAPFIAVGPSNTTLQRTGARGAGPGR
jgi:hypothetical protein